MSRWRNRLGEVGMEELLAQSIQAAKRANVSKPSSMQRVIVDTTVTEKAIAYPTDSGLRKRSSEYLVKAARQCSLHLRQNYNREAPRLVQQIGRYAHAKKFRRMRAALCTPRSRVGRVHRDIARQLNQMGLLQRKLLDDLLARTSRILTQQRRVKNKLYALHTPEVECIAKGKARKTYKSGVKVSTDPVQGFGRRGGRPAHRQL